VSASPAPRALDAPCAAVAFAGDAPIFAFADGTIRRWEYGRAARAHSALLATAVSADGALLTAGEDGRVCRTASSGDPVELAAIPRKWVVCVAAGAAGTLAFAVGRSAWLRRASGELTEIAQERGIAALAFSPDGESLATACHDGVRLHAVKRDAPPVELAWRGIYSELAFSPDGRFVLALMQDALLHGWRLPDAHRPARHFRMTGYPARIRSWSWSDDDRWLATAGAHAAILWPFDSEEGPIGTTPLELGRPRDGALVSAVACRPGRAEVAIGYEDGALAVAAIGTRAQWLSRPRGRGALRSLAWHAGGALLAFGSEAGERGVIEVPH
jgi:WD40 repeat protein